MKKQLVLICVIMALMMGSCLVKSLHPFYKEEDVEFRESLIGSWMDQDSCIWEFSQKMTSAGFLGPEKAQNSYEAIYYEEDSGISFFELHLFRIKSKYYLDFFPLSEKNIEDNFAGSHYVPTHSIARIEFFGAENLAFFWYDQEWLNQLFEERRVKISHEKINKDDYVLTADTEDLQKFISKYGKENDIFLKFNPDLIKHKGNPDEYHHLIEKEIEFIDEHYFEEGKDILYINMKKL